MQALAKRLRAQRDRRGSLDFDIPEAVVLLDEDDPRRVRDVRRSRGLPEVKEAYRLVEDFMLAANEAVARFFKSRGLDTLWRVHEPPSLERLEEFAALAESFGLRMAAEEGRSPRKLRDFLEKLKGRPMERSLSFLLLRALKQAVYDVVNVGHFGLAAPEYLHFTSPIRRYPDLVVHRLLKLQLRAEGLPAGGVKQAAPPPREELQRWAADSSGYERRAMEAEREVVDMYRAFLMRDRVGDEYDGTVVGVTSFGIFVEIADPFVEGLVKADRLGEEPFEFDERTVRLVGRRSGRSFALGDEVRVRIENVSVPRRKIDLALVEHAESSPRATPPPQRRREPPRPQRRDQGAGGRPTKRGGDRERGRPGKRRR
jgi:ribonuclease R